LPRESGARRNAVYVVLGKTALTQSNTGTVQVDGVVGGFTDYDSLVAALRARIDALNLSHRVIEELAGMAEGSLAKYLADLRVKHLSITSLLQISEAVGVRGLLVIDEKLLRRMRPHYEQRETRKIHARRHAKLGATTMKRVRPVVLSELGKAGAAARNAKLSAEARSTLASMAARARWRAKRS
jgi:transcriptional regulator with XRE-family HTH domain